MQLTESERDFLAGPRFAVVSTLGEDGLPHQTVTWYGLLDEGLLLSIPKGSVKHRNLLRVPRLSVCVEDGYRYLTVQGEVTLEDRPEQARADYEWLTERYRDTLASRPIIRDRAQRRRMQAMLARPRITVHLRVDKIINYGVTP